MSVANDASASCLCNAVQIKVAEMSKHVGACHCEMCRNWGGAALMAVDCGTDVTFVGEKHITLFDSSVWADRGFCSICGSHLFYRLKENQQYMIPVGLFGEQQGLVFDHQVFIDKKPTYYDFANETEDMTEAEIFAKYGGA